MKRLDKNIDIKIPPTRLYLDDIRAMTEVLSAEYPGVSIHSCGFEFASADELKQLKRKAVYQLSFQIPMSSLSLYFEDWGARLQCYNPTTKNLGVIKKIERILSSRFSLWKLVFNGYAYVLFLFITLVLPYFIPTKQASLGLLVAFISLFLLVMFIAYKRHTIIYMYEKNEKSNFFDRNGDKIILLIFGAMMGFFLKEYGVALAKVVQTLFSS